MMLGKIYKNLKGNPKKDEIIERTLEILDKHLEQFKYAHPNEYKDIENCLYIMVYGYHFNQEMLNDAISCMINDDGSTAPKWTVSETTQVAKNNGIVFKNFNEYDWNYVMNMIYSDYCNVLGDNLVSYIKLSHKFLDDKDAPEGKALRYSMCMKKDYSK